MDDADQQQNPFISVIIPNRNQHHYIKQILEGLFQKTDYGNLEVLVIDNGSDDPQVLRLYQKYRQFYDNFSISIMEEPFNFSSMINRGFKLAKGDHCLLLNNDIEVIEPSWIKEMVFCLSGDNIGIVGAKLLFPNDTIQHAGVIVGLRGTADHWFKGEPRETPGPGNCLLSRQSITCVTGAAMLIAGKCREALGDWNERDFAISYNDVDYCLRARKLGFQVIWTPHAELYHHESISRGRRKNWKDWWRFQKEKRSLKRIHKTHRFKDPALKLVAKS